MNKTVMTTLAGAFILAMATGTQAGTVSLNPAATTAGIGDAFDVTILGSFAGERVFGADLDLTFDTGVIALTGVDFDTVTWDFGVSPGLPSLAGQDDILVNANAAYPTGNFTFATLHFSAVGAGDALIGLAGSTIIYGCGEGGYTEGGFLGSFCDTDNFPMDAVNFSTATVTVAAAPVPLPAAIWALGAGMAGFGVVGRRSRKA